MSEQQKTAGYKVVPVEPTDEMVWKAEEDSPPFYHGDPWYGSEPPSEGQINAIYKAMLEAAPPHQSEQHLEMVNTPAPSVPDGWRSLTDVEWMNIVNFDSAYSSYDKEGAVNEAVKRTEAKLKELNAAQQQEPPADLVPGGWRSAIAKEFPLYDEDGLDEDKHCCEWVMLQDRKRLHKILAAPQPPKLSDERILEICGFRPESAVEVGADIIRKRWLEIAREIEREILGGGHE